MYFSQVVEQALASTGRTPLLLLGPPGTGKTSIGPALADAMTVRRRLKDPEAEPASCTILDLSSRLPEDIGGLPFIKDGVTHYAPQSWLARLCKPGAYGVLVLDDLPAAATAVQVAVRQLVLDRAVGDHKLSPDIKIIVTGNRREDKSAASTLPSHFLNCVTVLEVHIDLDEWTAWYHQQVGLAPIIPTFLGLKRNFLSQLPAQGDKNGSFATPRSWAKLGAEFEASRKLGSLREVAMGMIGEGVASEFMTYVEIRANLVPPDEILRNPQKAIPDPIVYFDRPDKAHAAVTGIAETAAAWVLKGGKEGKAAFGQFLEALTWLTAGGKEHAAVAVTTFASNCKNQRKAIDTLGEVYRKEYEPADSPKHDPKMTALMNYIVKTMSGKDIRRSVA